MCSYRDLTGNKVTMIADGAFTVLGNLTELCVTMHCYMIARCNTCSCRSLTSNQITSIAYGAFTGLGRLTILYVSITCHFTA